MTRWYGDNQSAPVTRTRQYGYDAMLPVISEIYHTTSGNAGIVTGSLDVGYPRFLELLDEQSHFCRFCSLLTLMLMLNIALVLRVP